MCTSDGVVDLNWTDKGKSEPYRIVSADYDSFYMFTINIIDTENFLKEFENIKAKHKAQVRVVFEGQSREYTLDEFKTLLGFVDKLAERI